MTDRRDGGSETTPATSIWELPAPAFRSAPGLSRDRIVDAAIEIADSDGMAGLTMRQVAGALHCSPMSLYRHVPGKEQLLDLMLDHVIGEQDLAGLPSGNWIRDLHQLANAQRSVAQEHPWSIDPAPRPTLGPHGLERLEIALAVFGAADEVPIDTRAWAISTVDAYVRGSVGAELALKREQQRSGMDATAWQLSVEPYMSRAMATGRYPMIAQYVTQAADLSPDQLFTAGLDAVVTGIGAAIPVRPPG